MRVGLTWDLDSASSTTGGFALASGEATTAAMLGYDSVWIREGRSGPASCSHPALLLTALSRRDSTLQLRSIREVVGANPVRIAEEVGVLDVFSRGRAGIAFAAAGRQSRPPSLVHETVDFVRNAWAADEFRYRGEHIRFPSHTPDDAPTGASFPGERGAGGYVPQWEWGPATPDFLTITPKPHCPRPPVYVEIDDDETLEWAAATGVSPFVAADVPTADAVERLVRYRKAADSAGRDRADVEVVMERVILGDAEPGVDGAALSGDAEALVATVRDIAAVTGLGHLVWRRRGPGDGDMFRFAVDVYPLLQG